MQEKKISQTSQVIQDTTEDNDLKKGRRNTGQEVEVQKAVDPVLFSLFGAC